MTPLFRTICENEGLDPDTLESGSDAPEISPGQRPVIKRIYALMAYLDKGCLQLTEPVSHVAKAAISKTRLALSKFDVFGSDVWDEVLASGKDLERIVADVRGRMNEKYALRNLAQR